MAEPWLVRMMISDGQKTVEWIHHKMRDDGEVGSRALTSESVEGSSLSLESIDDIHGGDGLPLGVLSIGDRISDDIFQEDLEDSSGFFVDQARNTFDTSSSCQPSDGGFGDSLDVITKDLSMPLCASLSETFSSLSSTRHVGAFGVVGMRLMSTRQECKNSG